MQFDVVARCIINGDNNILYQFSLHSGGRLLIEGRAAVILNTDHVEHADDINLALNSGETA